MRTLLAALALLLCTSGCSDDAEPSASSEASPADTLSEASPEADVATADPNTPTLAPPTEGEGFQLATSVSGCPVSIASRSEVSAGPLA